jgi:hypothetical protein
MAIRVALAGTGNCGSLALRQLVTDERFDVAGVWVSSSAKVGRDAGELAGLDVVTGVSAVADLDELVATDPECVVYCAMGDVRLKDAMADVRKFLAAGIDVVGSAPGVLQYPWRVIPEKYIERVEDAAREGIRASSSLASIQGSRPTCCRWPWQAPARAFSRCAPWRSPTTPPMTG